MSEQRFSRAARLLAPPQFDRVMREGTRQGGAFFRLHVIANTLGHARLGITVAKRNVPLSVQRNRIRRQIRESFRLHAPRALAIDVVIAAKPGLTARDNAALRGDLARLFEWLRALKPADMPGTIAP